MRKKQNEHEKEGKKMVHSSNPKSVQAKKKFRQQLKATLQAGSNAKPQRKTTL